MFLQNLAVQSLEGIVENLSQSESLLEKLYIPLTYGVMVLYQMNLKTSFQMKQNLQEKFHVLTEKDDCLYYDNEHSSYIEYATLSSKQTAVFVATEYHKELKKDIRFYISFGIANKKKQLREWLFGEHVNLGSCTTGRCGLEGLIWAKRKLIELEKELLSVYQEDQPVSIWVQWSDTRRKKVYQHYLQPLGYQIVIDPEWGMALTKNIKKNA